MNDIAVVIFTCFVDSAFKKLRFRCPHESDQNHSKTLRVRVDRDIFENGEKKKVWTGHYQAWKACPGRGNFQTDLPGSDIPSAIDSVVIHGGDKSVIKFTKTALGYNMFLVTSPTQADGARDSEMSTTGSFYIRF